MDDKSIFVAIYSGVICGAVSLVLLSARFVRWRLPTSEVQGTGYVFAAMGGIVVLLPAYFIGITAGGSLGGAMGQMVSSGVGMQNASMPVGVSLGIAVIF